MRGFRAPKIPIASTPEASDLPFASIRITSRNNKTLHAWFLPNKPDAACIIIMHGWGGNAELMLPVAEPFFAAGLNVLLPDARGHGDSDSDTFSSMPRFAEDIEACIDWLYSEPERWNQTLILLGHSVGAGAVLLVASRDPRVKAVISLSAFSHPDKMMQRYLGRFPAWLRRLIISQVQKTIGHKLDDIAPLNTIGKIRCPVLLAHGLADTTVPADEAREIAANATDNPPRLVLIEGADHDSVEIFHQHADTLIDFLQEQRLIAGAARQTRQKR
ncbi:MAG: alpha/beta fold hydrolase [Gammaproteobacteria bacterium]|nr:alpha/beta fold hydrolase [Gammaproteobacteria bacterium]